MFRIQRANVRPTIAERESDEQPIIITALKLGQTANDAPAAVSVFLPGALSRSTTLPNSGTLAREATGLSVTGVGEGLNRLFLRGVGDSPFNGFGQDSVAILFDEARLTYDAPDPGLALVDIARVEILEGPQGPLYGTGSLGGIVKIVPNAPDPSKIAGAIDSGLSSVADGDVGGDVSAMINLPVFNGDGAVRAVIYGQTQPGWIDNAGGRSDINQSRMRGGRIAALWKPSNDWNITFAASLQASNAGDSQYVDGGLGPLQRPNRMAEGRDTDSQLLSATVRGKIGSIDLTSITALSRFEVVADYDATPLAATLGTVGATRARDDRAYSLLDQEVRLEGRVDDRWKWLAGTSFLNASTKARVTLRDTLVDKEQLKLDRSVMEVALFGETTYAFSSLLSA
ncbi:MAG: TonB-dependent receptor plug domain-containing protein, partial [Sphingomicrobium sp.]